jgi:NTP pyrophosphatase (non-canonical NTP hydrolase)
MEPTTQTEIAEISKYIDNNTAPAFRNNETLALFGRVGKVQEEAGEVMAALIGFTGENPRKGITHTADDVVNELLDVALTALCAVEHMVVNLDPLVHGGHLRYRCEYLSTADLFSAHVHKVHKRLI